MAGRLLNGEAWLLPNGTVKYRPQTAQSTVARAETYLNGHRLDITKEDLRKAVIAAEQAPAGLPTESQARKDTPVYSGVLAYFPDAIAEVARLSKVGNDKHNPGEPLHWAKEKSTDHDDCIARHQLDRSKGEVFLKEHGSAKIRTRAAIAWRALAALQVEIENETKGNK